LSRTLLTLSLAVLAVAGLAPVAVMILRVVQDPAALQGLLDERTLSLLGRTLLLGGGAAGLALLVGAPFGYLTARTDLPGATWLRSLGLVPLIMPPLLLAVSWTVLVPQLRGAPMTILLMGLSTFPIVALFTAKAARRVDGRREEAALLSGGLSGVLRMEFGLLLPAALSGTCFAFLFAASDFAVPDFVSSVGRKFNVYADEVFATWQVNGSDSRAVATALPLVVLILAALLPALALRRRGTLATLDSDFVAPRTLSLGSWRWPLGLAAWGLITLGALIPVGRMLFEAGGGPSGWSVYKFQAAFGKAIDLCRDNLLASLGYSILAATLALPVALVLGHAIARWRHGWFLEMLCVLPLAAPAILFGIGNIAVWNGTYTYAFYTSGGMVVVLYIGRFLAFPTLISASAVASMDRELEQAAELAGASPMRRMARIVAPALLPSLMGGWILMFVLAMRELDTAILVPAANDTVMFRMFNAVHFGRDDFVAALALLIIFVTIVPGVLWRLFSGKELEVLP
jgi:iron(III) transport system permease protein